MFKLKTHFINLEWIHWSIIRLEYPFGGLFLAALAILYPIILFPCTPFIPAYDWLFMLFVFPAFQIETSKMMLHK